MYLQRGICLLVPDMLKTGIWHLELWPTGTWHLATWQTGIIVPDEPAALLFIVGVFYGENWLISGLRKAGTKLLTPLDQVLFII
jgi:hypothetical protein